MERYDPSIAPDPVQWLEADEADRIMMIEEHHIEAEGEDAAEDPMAHAAIHLVVENQIALEVEPVPATLKKLMRQGLDRHEAIHAIGAVLSEQIFSAMEGKNPPRDTEKYRRRLESLTAERWRKGQW